MSSLSKDQKRRKALILSAVQDQLDSSESPDVRVEFDRLRALGHGDQEARELIAIVLASYIWHQMKGDGYGYREYVAELKKLPVHDYGH